MTRALPAAIALLSLLASVSVARSARGQPSGANGAPIYVLSIWTEDADDQADALTQALRARVQQAPGWSLLQANQSFETLLIALKCPPKPDPACLQRIGDQLKADTYIWGTMDNKKKGAPGEVSTDLHLWARGKPDMLVRDSYPDNLKDPNDQALRAIAADLFAKLTGTVSPTQAAPAAGLQTARDEAGPPSAPASAETPTASAIAPGAESERGGFSARSVFAFSALAVGAGLLVASGIEAANWINDANRSSDDRKTVPATVTDVCTDTVDPGARDACDRSKDAMNASTLAWIFGGVGVGLVGAGVWLIATDHASSATAGEQASRDAHRSRLELLPSIGPRAGAVRLRFSF